MSLADKMPRLAFISAILITVGAVLSVAYLHFVVRNTPRAPAVLTISECGELQPNVKRIGDKGGFQFDVDVRNFAITEGTQDMPPFVHGYRLMPKHGTHVLEISFGESPKDVATDSKLVFSGHFEKRGILDPSGHQIGEDDWGYLESGESWRQVEFFKGRAVAKYGFVNENEANIFDRIVGSACIL
ncbi:MAG TPA: hypothetical protein VGR50_07335 [Terriglobales bacterium]|nr:hypothetical protein [Terriglobales bacterium]